MRRVHLVQEPLQLGFDVDEPFGMGVDADGHTMLLGPHPGHRGDAVAEGGPLGGVCLRGGLRATGGGRAARRDAVDQHRMPRPMCRQRPQAASVTSSHLDKGYHPCCVLPGYEMYCFTILGGRSRRSLKQSFQPTLAAQLHTIPGILNMVAKFK